MQSKLHKLTLAGLISCGLIACQQDEQPSPAPDTADMNQPSADMGAQAEDLPKDSVTYHRDVRPLFEQRCVSCHTQGGIAPFSMRYEPAEWAQGAPWWAAASVKAVTDQTMPPWMPAQDCRPLEGDRAMPAQERDIIARWGALQHPVGQEADYSPPAPADTSAPDLGAPTMTLKAPEPYTPTTQRPDDYRCFVLDADFAQETYIRGVHVREDKRAIVHHVIVYMIPPDQVAAIEQLDQGEAGAGYTCYGGPGASGARNIGGWVPGALPTLLPEGLAHVVPAGSKLVLQLHYNTLNITSGEQPPADQTEVDLWALPPDQQPTHEVRVIPLANLLIDIPAGEASSVQDFDYRVTEEAELIGTTPHMHTLGAAISLEHISQDSQQASCLINIPRWDFNWQQSYTFTEGQAIQVKPGDVLRQRCVYDNSPENQPLIDGVQQTPRRVTWGEGTLDEMCLTYAIIKRPYVKDQGLSCALNQACFAQCATDDAECFKRCAFYTHGECAACGIATYFSCPTQTHSDCLTQGIALQRCARGCQDGGELDCLAKTCADKLDDFAACANPYFRDGRCDMSDCAK